MAVQSKAVFERRTSTVSEAFPLFICIEATKFVLLSLSSFTFTEKICTTIWPNPGGVGVLPYISHSPKNSVFAPFWSEIGYRLCPLVWNQSLCLSSSLKMITLFLPIPGLKTGVNLRQPALKKKKRCGKKHFVVF